MINSTAQVELEVVDAAARLEALRPEWSALWRRCPTATVFQSPEWLLPWWRHLGEGALATLALREEGRLCALIPLFIRAGDDGKRRAALLGEGISDTLDVLAEPGREALAASALLAWLARERRRWDDCVLPSLRAKSPLLEANGGSFVSEEFECDPCPVLVLPGAEHGPREVIPAPMRKNLDYYARRARTAGEVRFERADAANFAELFGALLHLHAARWEARRLPGVLADRCVREFQREAASGLLTAGALRLYAMRLEGRIIATYYGFLHGGRASDYLCGFDPHWRHLSPGALVVAHALGEAIAEGALEFDFLRGREDYKYRWGARDRLCLGRILRQD